MQDVITALMTHLATVSAVTDLVGARIWGGEIPPDEIKAMPRKAIILRYAGGLEEFRTHREQKPRIIFFAYGEGYLQAGQVDRAVADVLIEINTLDIANTLIYSVAYAGGPRQQKESDTGWRFVTRTATARAGECSTA